MIRFAFLAVAVLAMQGCPPSPTPPAPDASDAAPPPVADAAPAPIPSVDASTPSTQACVNIARLGCAEGAISNCAATLDHVDATKITKIDIACLAAAKTKAAVRACGSIACP
jgi:hypothetical protein